MKTIREQFEEETGYNCADRAGYYDSVYAEWLEKRIDKVLSTTFDLKELKDITDEIEKILSEFNSVHFTTEQIQETSKRIAVYFPVQREPDGYVVAEENTFISVETYKSDTGWYSDARPVYFSPLPSVNEKEVDK